MKAKELARQIKRNKGPVVIDVRSGFEYRSGHIPGALHASLLKLFFRRVKLPDDLGTPLVLTCEHGPRAQVAKGMLEKRGYRSVTLLDEQMVGWRRYDLPLER
ncbi:MAG: rhodanese-like domain-containing protein [Desulfuromonas sp.]|nr:MAG: rhodanese-like domain-containing protein [Desulfuromonas sp.]